MGGIAKKIAMDLMDSGVEQPQVVEWSLEIERSLRESLFVLSTKYFVVLRVNLVGYKEIFYNNLLLDRAAHQLGFKSARYLYNDDGFDYIAVY